MNTIKEYRAYALLLIPFLLGCASICLVLGSASGAQDAQLEGALFLMALMGWGVTLVCPPLAAGLGWCALRARRVPFPVFFWIMLLALAPVAYYQCANMQSSILLAYMTDGMTYNEITQAYPRLVTEAGALFGAVVCGLTYVLYRIATPPR